jgi:hypothetical protein
MVPRHVRHSEATAGGDPVSVGAGVVAELAPESKLPALKAASEHAVATTNKPAMPTTRAAARADPP